VKLSIYQQLLPARFEQASNFNMGLPPSSLSTSAKIVGGVLLTFVGGWFAFIFVEYGAIGAYAAIRNHLTWTYAGFVYWIRLLIGVLCAAGVVASWVLLFAPKNPRQRDGGAVAKLPQLSQSGVSAQNPSISVTAILRHLPY
jgi:hypothetical protein